MYVCICTNVLCGSKYVGLKTKIFSVQSLVDCGQIFKGVVFVEGVSN